MGWVGEIVDPEQRSDKCLESGFGNVLEHSAVSTFLLFVELLVLNFFSPLRRVALYAEKLIIEIENGISNPDTLFECFNLGIQTRFFSALSEHLQSRQLPLECLQLLRWDLR